MRLGIPGPNAPIWVLTESAIVALFSLFSMLLISREIGPAAAGAGAVATAAFLFLDLVGATLFPDAICQRPDLTQRHVRSALTVSVLVGLGAALLLGAAAPLLGAASGQAGLPPLLLALAPLLPVSAFSGTASGLSARAQRFRFLALRVLMGQPVALGLGLVAAVSGLGSWALIIYQAATTLVTAALFLAGGQLPLRPLLDRVALAALWPVAGPQIVALVLVLGRYRLFLVAIGLIAMQAVVAQAHLAFRMLDAVLGMASVAISRLAMPRLCLLQADRSALARCYGEVVQLQALFGLPVALGIALSASDLVQALLGPAWSGAAEAARIAGFAATLGLLHGDHVSLFVAVGKARWNMRLALAGTLAPLAVLLLFRPGTPAGLALAWGSQGILVVPVIIWMVLRELDRSPGWLLRHVAPALAATAAMVLAVLTVQDLLADAAPLLRLVATAAAGALVYGGVALLALGGRLPAGLRTTPIRAAIPDAPGPRTLPEEVRP